MARKSKKFPINVKKHTKEVFAQIVEDLLQKFPKGPNGVLTKDDYDYWNTDPCVKHEVAGKDTICGYKFIDLYRAIIASGLTHTKRPTSSENYEDVVTALYPKCRRRAITRRSRRLACRIGNAVRSIIREGLPGIYMCTWGYSETQKIRMYAQSSEDASHQFKLFFGPACPKSEISYVRASFLREGSALELMSINQKPMKACDREIAILEAKIENIKKEIEDFNTKKSFIEMYSANCMAANG